MFEHVTNKNTANNKMARLGSVDKGLVIKGLVLADEAKRRIKHLALL